jgi:hypothetical protein
MWNPCASLGYDEKLEILSRSGTIYSLHDNLRRTELQIDLDDFMLPLFRGIYSGEVRREFIDDVRPAGLPDQAADEYVNFPGNRPFMQIQANYASHPDLARNAFILHARQSILRLLKRELRPMRE